MKDLFFAGIDYGSKTAGTTVVAFLQENRICFRRSEKKRDADDFLARWCRTSAPAQIFLDAPLSLPGVFRGLPDCNDYFYRRADRALNAMSPMFLGGLTARAMRLKDQLAKENIAVYEVYPGKLAELLELDKSQYKKSKKFLLPILQRITARLPWEVKAEEVDSWHHIDALLAFISGWRYQQDRHHIFGLPEEGQIIV